MKASRLRRLSLTRPPLAVALLLILLVPSSIGIAQTDGSGPPVEVNAVICPNCCYSECYTGTWYAHLYLCNPGGNGSCMSCDTRCGPFFRVLQPVP